MHGAGIFLVMAFVIHGLKLFDLKKEGYLDVFPPGRNYSFVIAVGNDCISQPRLNTLVLRHDDDRQRSFTLQKRRALIR